MRKLASTAVFLTAATAAGAAPVELTGNDISPLVSGSVVEIDTPLGKKIPVRYDAAGRMSGNAAGLESYLGSSSDSGRWWVEANQLCHRWSTWFSGEVQCLKLRKDGSRVYWRNQ